MTDAAAPAHDPDDSDFARSLRGFGPPGILAILAVLAGNFLVLPLSAVLALVWAHVSRTPWREIGYVRPRSWTRDLLVGVTLGVALKLVMKTVVMPLLGAPPINPTYHYLAGNTAAALLFAIQIVVFAGFGEETVFRGYMFERLGKLLGHGAGAKVATVLLTSALFGAAHYIDQGLPGVEQATIVGLIYGAIFAVQGRLWMLMCAHVAFDWTALAIIYWNLESAVAHFFFK